MTKTYEIRIGLEFGRVPIQSQHLSARKMIKQIEQITPDNNCSSELNKEYGDIQITNIQNAKKCIVQALKEFEATKHFVKMKLL